MHCRKFVCKDNASLSYFQTNGYEFSNNAPSGVSTLAAVFQYTGWCTAVHCLLLLQYFCGCTAVHCPLLQQYFCGCTVTLLRFVLLRSAGLLDFQPASWRNPYRRSHTSAIKQWCLLNGSIINRNRTIL